MALARVGSSFMPRNNLLVSIPISKPNHQTTVIIRCAKPSRPPGSKGKPPKTNSVLRGAERSVTLESTGSVIRRMSDDVAEDSNINNTSTAATQVDFSANTIVQAEVSI
ncbi:hypothetical protein Ddye_026498 [Dipteronia dyeriana]|uniref:Uncharacterized protein n=1 Tax=Dipteronia dyeriana TaxID=168575 RepID=A0AAD9WQJ0_9ROSI|nr:hypothetical protein Ddye_026498 [Dipteronia dyeriana]